MKKSSTLRGRTARKARSAANSADRRKRLKAVAFGCHLCSMVVAGNQLNEHLIREHGAARKLRLKQIRALLRKAEVTPNVRATKALTPPPLPPGSARSARIAKKLSKLKDPAMNLDVFTIGLTQLPPVERGGVGGGVAEFRASSSNVTWATPRKSRK